VDFKLKSGALLLFLGFGAAAADAGEPGWYFVGFAGEATASGLSESQSEDNIAAIFQSVGLDVVSADSNIDDSDTSYGLAGGYQLNDHLAFEFSYVDLGSFNNHAAVTLTDGSTESDADLVLETSASGPVVSVLGVLPIGGRFSLYGRAGLTLLSADGRARITVDGESQRASQSSDKTDPVFGVGAEFSFSKYWALRLAWDRYLDVGTEDVSGDIDADVVSLGIRMGGGWFR
jgi:OOP family OmpA-OmpF porin